MDNFLRNQLYKWTYDKLKSNPKKYGGDFGNAEIMHTFLLEFFGNKIVASLEVHNFSILSSVSRIRNKLLEQNPQFDMRIKYKRKKKNNHKQKPTNNADRE